MTEDTPALSGTYADFALAYMAYGWEVLPVSGKFPPVSGATGREGIVNADKVEMWRRDPTTADLNIALRASTTWIGIDVDQYGQKVGAEQLKELEAALGELPVTISSTSRGEESPSRTYLFQVPEGRDYLSKAAPDIDIIQRSHRYLMCLPSWHPDTGEQYAWYGPDGEALFDLPHVDDMERLPEAWLEWLTVDPQKSYDGFSGNVDEWLETLPQGAPSAAVQRWIDGIPRDGFNHTDVTRLTWNLVRMGAEGHPGVRQALEALYSAWVQGEYADVKYVKELDVAIRGAIQKAGRSEVLPSHLPKFFDSMALLPANVDGQKFLTATDLPKLAQDLFDLLDSERDVASIVWKRAQALGIHDDEFPGLYQMILDTKRAREEAPGAQQEVEYALVSDAEREEARTQENWLGKYLSYAHKKTGKFYNEPYNRAAGWIAMSLAFAKQHRLAIKPQMPLAFYFFSPGPSSSGKNTSLNALTEFGDALCKGKTYRVGAQGSWQALHDRVRGRDGNVTLMVSDEISGELEEWLKPGGIYRPLIEGLLKWYEGEVPPREGVRNEESTTWASTMLSTYFLGTPAKMLNVLTEKEFASGFLPRFLWAFGDPVSEDVDYESYLSGDKTDMDAHQAFLAEWADQITAENPEWRQFLEIDRESIVLLNAAFKKLNRWAKAAGEIGPSFTRMQDNILRACGLLAASRSSARVERPDVIFVLSEAERWIRDLMKAAGQIESSPLSRKLNSTIAWMKQLKMTDIPADRIMRYLSDKHQEDVALANRTIGTLLAQGRIEDQGGGIFYRLKEEKR